MITHDSGHPSHLGTTSPQCSQCCPSRAALHSGPPDDCKHLSAAVECFFNYYFYLPISIFSACLVLCNRKDVEMWQSYFQPSWQLGLVRNSALRVLRIDTAQHPPDATELRSVRGKGGCQKPLLPTSS